MNRRQFLLALAAFGSGTAFPVFAAIEKPLSEVAPFGIREADSETHQPFGSAHPKIGLVAVGSAGCGMLTSLHGKLPYLSRTVAIDTSPFALYRALADQYILIGAHSDKPSDPNAARFLAKAAKREIQVAVADLDIVFILGGLGGAAGTGISPIVADITREAGVLTVAAPVFPFSFEGGRRLQIAKSGVNALSRRAQATVVLPNELFSLSAGADELLNTVLEQAPASFEHLYRSIAMVFSQQSLIGTDQEDFRAAMSLGNGHALFGYGAADGSHAALDALDTAVKHVLLGPTPLSRTAGVFVAVEAKPDSLKMASLSRILKSMGNYAPSAQCFYGAVPNTEMDHDFRVSILATGNV